MLDRLIDRIAERVVEKLAERTPVVEQHIHYPQPSNVTWTQPTGWPNGTIVC
jgi:hypothetical protein